MIISSLSPDIARTVFFSTGAFFSLRVLDELIASGYPPVAVVIPEFPAYKIDQKDRLPLQPPEKDNLLIKVAKDLNQPVIFAPENQGDALLNQLSKIDFDFILVACWPYKLSKAVCQLARKSALNLHPSLLPEFRGANPVEEQLRQGGTHFGVSLHLLSDEFDAGDIVKQAGFELSGRVDRKAIEQQAADLGAQLFIEACEEFDSPDWHPVNQEIKHESKPDQ